MGIFAFSNKDKTNVVETKTFSEISGFSFEYPVFKGWEVNKIMKIDTDKYSIFLQSPILTNIAPSIIVQKKDYTEKDFEIPADAVTSPNPNGVPYLYTKENSLLEIKNNAYVAFYGQYKVWVNFNFSEKTGFPVEQFMKKTIATFKFAITKEQAIDAVKKDAESAYQDLSLFNVSATLESDGWHVDYLLKKPIPGGGPHYVVDAYSGKIVTKRYEQ